MEEGDVHSLMMAMGFLPQCSIKAGYSGLPPLQIRGRKEGEDSGAAPQQQTDVDDQFHANIIGPCPSGKALGVGQSEEMNHSPWST